MGGGCSAGKDQRRGHCAVLVEIGPESLSYSTDPGETPFSLVYSTEAVLPAEVGLPTWRQRGFEEEKNSKALKEQLNFIDELRDKALFTIKFYC
ncbi:hypothetical protein LIER_34588 [Lithospermum erythrorhizon]|uniref:Uncharacterized protein n=1 Tax=Lithospermum erythrorhizon TaxID=34254 RepID=A0AAV3S289_LITER